MRSAVPSPLAVCALWESLSDFQLCEGFNRPSVLTVLSGIVAPRVFQPSNIHQYFASALTYCSLSPCLDRFIRSPGRRWKLTNYFGWVDSSSCVPPPPLQQSQSVTVFCICSNLSFSVALSWSVNIRSFSFVLTVEKTPAVPCITGWRLRRWFRWFWPGRRCKSSPLNSTFNDNVAFASGPGFESRSCHLLDLFSVVPSWNPRPPL